MRKVWPVTLGFALGTLGCITEFVATGSFRLQRCFYDEPDLIQIVILT